MTTPFAGGRPFSLPAFYADYYRRAMNPYAPVAPAQSAPAAAPPDRGWHNGRFLPFGMPAAPVAAPSPETLLQALQRLGLGAGGGPLFLLGGEPPPVSE